MLQDDGGYYGRLLRSVVTEYKPSPEQWAKYQPSPEQWASVREQIRTLANVTYPQEACGFIFLTTVEPVGPLHVAAVNNIADWPYAQFRIADEDTRWALGTGRCIGVWHSHPADPAVPSELDAELAVKDIYFVIYAVQDEDLAVFQRDELGQLIPETIVMPA